jgi:putative glutamine amidotransferase
MRPRIGITSAPDVQDRDEIDRVIRCYVDAVVRAGGLPLILPTLQPEDAAEVVAVLDGLLLTGGGDVSPQNYGAEVAPETYGEDPARDAWELALVRAAAGLPVLGVCRGAQLLNVAAGGTLIQHLAAVTDIQHWHRDRERELVHSVDVDPASLLAEIVGERSLGVNSVHHQAVEVVGEGFRPVAWSGDGVVEAIERSDGAPVLGVQWHPEWVIDVPHQGDLFLWLTRAAARRRPGLEPPSSLAPAPSEVVAAPPGGVAAIEDVA